MFTGIAESLVKIVTMGCSVNELVIENKISKMIKVVSFICAQRESGEGWMSEGSGGREGRRKEEKVMKEETCCRRYCTFIGVLE